jgi:hypothetical protein
MILEVMNGDQQHIRLTSTSFRVVGYTHGGTWYMVVNYFGASVCARICWSRNPSSQRAHPVPICLLQARLVLLQQALQTFPYPFLGPSIVHSIPVGLRNTRPSLSIVMDPVLYPDIPRQFRPERKERLGRILSSEVEGVGFWCALKRPEESRGNRS